MTTKVVAAEAGLTLAPGESIINSASFSANNLFFFIKNSVALTDKRVAGNAPNTLLGVIPLGSNKVSYPLSSIASVHSGMAFSLFSLLAGLVLLFAGFQTNFIVSLIGLVFLANSAKATFVITNNAGQQMGQRMAIWDRAKAQDLASQVDTVLAGRA